MALFERRATYMIAQLDRFTLQAWRDRPLANGEVPIRVVINHPELQDPDDPNGAGMQFSVKPTSKHRPDGTNKTWRNLDRRLQQLGL